MKDLETKTMAATQTILAETGDKEFKGMRLKAICQCIEATIIPILTYGSEAWNPTKNEEDRIQKIFNTTLKMIINLPQGTPTTILLKESGFIPIRHEINIKRIMQARRIEEKEGNSLIKDNTTDSSIWMEKTMEKYHIQKWHLKLKKNTLKKILKQRAHEEWEKEIEKNQKKNPKINHWRKQRTNPKQRRPEYMERLTRKQSQAILRARTSMMTVKMNHKNGHETLKCRYCCEADETQEHIIKECTKIKRDEKPIRYAEIFKENNIETNRAIARALIEINQKKTKTNKTRARRIGSQWDEPPGTTRHMQCTCMYVCMYVWRDS